MDLVLKGRTAEREPIDRSREEVREEKKEEEEKWALRKKRKRKFKKRGKIAKLTEENLLVEEEADEEKESDKGPYRNKAECHRIFVERILPYEDDLKYLAIKTLGKEEASDIFQEALEICWRRLPYLKKENAVEFWAMRIMRNLVSDYYRDKMKMKVTRFSDFIEENNYEYMETEFDLEETRDALEVLLEIEDVNILLELCEELSGQTRAIIWYWFNMNCSLKQVAEDNCMNYNTVRTLYRRGILKLRELYEKRMEGGDLDA